MPSTICIPAKGETSGQVCLRSYRRSIRSSASTMTTVLPSLNIRHVTLGSTDSGNDHDHWYHTDKAQSYSMLCLTLR